jgi:hypothetical protein
VSGIGKITTPVGASATAAAVVNIALYLLSLWHAYAEVPTNVKGAVDTVLTAAAVYLAGWWNVTRQPGQTVQLSLTKSALPTVQADAKPE